MKIVFCRSCKKSIVWLRTRAGKMIPVDYRPELDPYAEVFSPDTMVAHFSTCPDAIRWRLKKQKPGPAEVQQSWYGD